MASLDQMVHRWSTGSGDAPFDAIGFVHANLRVDGRPAPVAGTAERDCIVSGRERGASIALPPRSALDRPIGEVLAGRASRRDFGQPIRIEDLATVLWSCSGEIARHTAYGLRDLPLCATPSAGGLMSVDLYVIVTDVDGLDPGAYRYAGEVHGLDPIDLGAFRFVIGRCCPGARWVTHAAAVVVPVIVLRRLRWKYGDASYRLAQLDAGVVLQTLYLVTAALGINGCANSVYDDEALGDALRLGHDEFVATMFAMGRKAEPFAAGRERAQYATDGEGAL